MDKRKKALIIAAGAVTALILAVAAFAIITVAAIGTPIVTEIGEEADLSRYETGFASAVCRPADGCDLSTDKLGRREITLEFFGFIKKNVPFIVSDTNPPSVVARNVTTVSGSSLSPDDFVLKTEDKTAVVLSFRDGEPDTGTEGVRDVTVIATDEGGNSTESVASLTVNDATMKVKLEFGVEDEEMKKAVSSAQPKLEETDFSGVDVRTCGEYRVTAFDQDGGLFIFEVEILDTTAPTAESRSFDVLLGSDFSTDSLVGDVFDLSPTKVRLGTEPDLSKPGEQKIPIIVSDAFGNSTELESELVVHAVGSDVTIERGTSDPDAASAVLCGDGSLSMTPGFSFSALPLGETDVELVGKYNPVTVSVTIEDTVAPEITLQRVTVFENQTVAPGNFVRYYTDASPVTFSFADNVATDVAGDFPVTIRAVDEAGNETAAETTLHVVRDTTPPVIYGVYYRTIAAGAAIPDFSDVYAVDNVDGVLAVDIDTSEVDTKTAGAYSVTYTVTDRAGNQSESSSTVYVAGDQRTILYSIADGILAQITNQGMTPREKAWAIYTWVSTNIRYSTSTSYLMGNYVEGALSGFRIRSGNCFIYYAVSDVLLERAGITSTEIQRNVPGRPHYWNLVFINGAWYHFDACPHYSNYPLTSFLLTDAQVKEYSSRCVDYYSFDPSLYPRTP